MKKLKLKHNKEKMMDVWNIPEGRQRWLADSIFKSFFGPKTLRVSRLVEEIWNRDNLSAEEKVFSILYLGSLIEKRSNTEESIKKIIEGNLVRAG